MKKLFFLIAALLLSLWLLGACGNTAGPEQAGPGSAGPRIVVTIFPEYDWVKNILGDGSTAQVDLLLDSGVDLHNYQPTADDILKISTCDLFIHVGGESDEWVEDALTQAANKNMTVINLLETMGDLVKVEQLVEGMEEDDHQDEDQDEDQDEGPEYDEHVWLSLRNAELLVAAISQALQDIDPDHAKTYAENAAAYTARLRDLDEEYRSALAGAELKTLLFADRFPFRYLTDDYGLKYYAAFAGCSAETEASFDTVSFLARKTEELALPAVMTIEGTNHRIAETVIGNTASQDQQILTLDSMQAITAQDIQNGADYLSIMGNNLAVIKQALNL